MSAAALYAWVELLILGILLSILTRTYYSHWLLGGFLAKAGRFTYHALQVLRTPGNITHEGGHAIGFLVAGYRVTGISFWFTDPQGRGYCQAGAPWAPWASGFLARLVAAPAPLFAGVLVLRLGAEALDVPPRFMASLTRERLLQPARYPWRSVLDALAEWVTTPVGALQALGFVALILSLSLDLAPSWEDVRSLSLSVVLVTAMLLLGTFLTPYVPVLQEPWHWLDQKLLSLILWVQAPLWWGLALLVVVALLLTPVRLVLSGWR